MPPNIIQTEEFPLHTAEMSSLSVFQWRTKRGVSGVQTPSIEHTLIFHKFQVIVITVQYGRKSGKRTPTVEHAVPFKLK